MTDSPLLSGGGENSQNGNPNNSMTPTGKKYVNVIPPAAIKDNASFTANVIDTVGFDWLNLVVQLGATDIAMSTLKLQHSPNANGSSAADIDGLTFAGSLPGATDDDDMVAFEVNLHGLDRYIVIVATAGDGTAGTFLSALGILELPSTTPVTAAAKGLNAVKVRT